LRMWATTDVAAPNVSQRAWYEKEGFLPESTLSLAEGVEMTV